MTPAEALAAWLESPAARDIEHRVTDSGTVLSDALKTLDEVTPDPASTRGVRALRERMALDDLPLERWLLARRGLLALDDLARTPLPQECRILTAEDIGALGSDAVSDRTLHESKSRFREFAKIVTGRRYAAGLFHFEIDGIPRAWLLSVPRTELARVWWFVAARMRGRAPVLVPHVTWRRPLPPITADEVNRSYLLMTGVLECQPALKGLAGSSWLRSPDTHRVSPNLACVNAPIVTAGGIETTMGPAPPDCGVLTRSETRKRLFDEGRFKPTIGLTLWPRDAMLRWALRLAPLGQGRPEVMVDGTLPGPDGGRMRARR
jgi:hypothetical protein